MFLQIIEVAVDVEEEFTVGDEGEPVAQPREAVADVVEGGGALQPHVGEVMLSALSVVVTHFFFILHVQIVALKEQNLIKIQNVIQGDHDGRRLGFVDNNCVIPLHCPPNSAWGPSIYDVRRILGFFAPPPCPHLGLIYSTKFTQPPLLHLLLG